MLVSFDDFRMIYISIGAGASRNQRGKNFVLQQSDFFIDQRFCLDNSRNTFGKSAAKTK
jgi:hypothetical protein